MVTLSTGVPVTQPSPQLLVENRFAPGTYRFQLVVIDDAGTRSAPALLTLTVTQPMVRPPASTTTTTGPQRSHLSTMLSQLAQHVFKPHDPP